jgi:hypothetical protein
MATANDWQDSAVADVANPSAIDVGSGWERGRSRLIYALAPGRSSPRTRRATDDPWTGTSLAAETAFPATSKSLSLAKHLLSTSYHRVSGRGVVIVGLQDRRNLRRRDNRDSRSRDSVRASRRLPGEECAKRHLYCNENPSSLRSPAHVPRLLLALARSLGDSKSPPQSVLRQVIPRRNSVDAGVPPMPPGGSAARSSVFAAPLAIGSSDLLSKAS